MLSKVSIIIALVLAVSQSARADLGFFERGPSFDFAKLSDQLKTSIQTFSSELTKSIDNMEKNFERIDDENSTDLSSILFANDLTHTRLAGCSCVNLTCSCVTRVVVEKLGLNSSVGLNLTYLSQEIGLELDLTIGERVIYEKNVSVSNPPPICAPLVGLKEAAEVCVKLYKLDVTKQSLSGCADLLVKVLNENVASVRIGCFRLAPRSRFYEQSILTGVEQQQQTQTSLINQFVSGETNGFIVKGITVRDPAHTVPSVSSSVVSVGEKNEKQHLSLLRKKRN